MDLVTKERLTKEYNDNRRIYQKMGISLEKHLAYSPEGLAESRMVSVLTADYPPGFVGNADEYLRDLQGDALQRRAGSLAGRVDDHYTDNYDD